MKAYFLNQRYKNYLDSILLKRHPMSANKIQISCYKDGMRYPMLDRFDVASGATQDVKILICHCSVYTL